MSDDDDTTDDTGDGPSASGPARSLRGRLLVATPLIGDPNFEKTVVLLLEHDADDGAVGVVVNRPGRVRVGEVLGDWDEVVTAPRVVFVGGPVSPEAAIALGEAPGVDAPWFTPVLGSLGTIDLDAEPETVADGVSRARVFSGYAGWGGGQLEAEVADGSWFVVDPSPDDALGGRRENLWHEVLRRQGGRIAWFSQYPDDVAAN